MHSCTVTCTSVLVYTRPLLTTRPLLPPLLLVEVECTPPAPRRPLLTPKILIAAIAREKTCSLTKADLCLY